jgi:ADP-ribose pyrophosphatase
VNPAPASPERRRKLGESLLAATRILELRHVRYRHDGRDQERDYVVIAAHDWVNVVAVTRRRTIVLVRQFRYGIDDFSLEIPGGVIEAGEDPVAAGVRELREETGYAGPRARLMASVHPNPAIQSNRCHFVLVEEAELQGPVAWDHDEEIEVTEAPVEQVLAWAREGRITHSLVVAALYHFEAVWRPGAV